MNDKSDIKLQKNITYRLCSSTWFWHESKQVIVFIIGIIIACKQHCTALTVTHVTHNHWTTCSHDILSYNWQMHWHWHCNAVKHYINCQMHRYTKLTDSLSYTLTSNIHLPLLLVLLALYYFWFWFYLAISSELVQDRPCS